MNHLKIDYICCCCFVVVVVDVAAAAVVVVHENLTVLSMQINY